MNILGKAKALLKRLSKEPERGWKYVAWRIDNEPIIEEKYEG